MKYISGRKDIDMSKVVDLQDSDDFDDLEMEDQDDDEEGEQELDEAEDEEEGEAEMEEIEEKVEVVKKEDKKH